MFAEAVFAAIRGTGHDVLYADVAATPTLGVLVRHHEAIGGVQISASHNPPEYNGLKLFGSDGRVISDGLSGNLLAALRHEVLYGEMRDALPAMPAK